MPINSVLPGNSSIDEAISSALGSVENDSEETIETVEEEVESSEDNTSEEQVETTSVDDNVIEIDASDLELLNKLKDPAQRDSTLRAMLKIEAAVENKLENAVKLPETKAQVKRTSRELAQELLGDELNLLPDKITDLIEQMIADKLQEGLQPVIESQTSLLRQSLDSQVTAAMGIIIKDFPDFPAYENEMNALTNTISPATNQSLKDYMLRIYHIAKAENPKAASGKTPEHDKKVTIRVQNNLRQPSNKTTPVPSARNTVVKAMSVDDAIRLAVKQTNYS